MARATKKGKGKANDGILTDAEEAALARDARDTEKVGWADVKAASAAADNKRAGVEHGDGGPFVRQALTDHDLALVANECGRLIAERAEVVEQRKDLVAEYREKLQVIDARITQLGEEMTTRTRKVAAQASLPGVEAEH